MLVRGHDGLVDRGLHKVGAEALARVGYHHVQVLLEVGELIDEQVYIKLSGLEKAVVD